MWYGIWRFNGMKLSKNKMRKTFITTLFVLFLTNVNAQDLKEADVAKLIDSKHFIFKPRSVMPLRGGTRQVTSEFDLKILGDSVVSYLPYFGRAFAAPYGSTEGGLKFTSTSFEYKVIKKNDRWDIHIVPKDTRDVRQLFLTISKTGFTNLQVINTNRDGISYSGYIEEIK